MKRLLFFAICFGTFTTCTSDRSSEKVPDATVIPHNIIVLLDLSDRIAIPGQIEKDKEIIRTIVESFEKNQQSFGYIMSRDLLRIMIAYEPNVNASTNDKMRISMEDLRPGGTSNQGERIPPGKPGFNKLKASFLQAVDQLYDNAAENPNPGADIYSFFCTELPVKYLDQNMQNKLIILTDGYLQFEREYLRGRNECTYMRKIDRLREERNWKDYFLSRKLQLCPCERPLNNLEVLLLEVVPREKAIALHEYDFIQFYWSTWLDEMGITKRIFPQEDKLNDIKEEVTTFLMHEYE